MSESDRRREHQELSGASVASSSARQEQIREATLTAEQALKRYQEESQPPTALLTYSGNSRPAPAPLTQNSRQASTRQLHRIPEDGEAAAPPQSLQAGRRQAQSNDSGDIHRALPRNFDPVTGRKHIGRPGLPYLFDPPKQGDFPNPHQSAAAGPSDSNLSTAQLQRRASQEMQSPLLSRQAAPRLQQAGLNPLDIPPTPPLGSTSTKPLSIHKNREPQLPAVAAATALAESITSTWSSSSGSSGDRSEPTPTASTIAATRERNAALASQLVPVQLTLPSNFPPARVDSMKAKAAPFAPSTPSKLSAPPVRADSLETSASGETVVLADGREVPAVRTDFENLVRISVPKRTASAGMEEGKGGASSTMLSPVHQAGLLQASGGGSDQRIPSPLSASAMPPQAPQIPQSRGFRKSVPSLDTHPQHPENKDATKAASGVTQPKSDDTPTRKRSNSDTIGYRNDPKRNTFGELAPSMLEEANKKLFLYQMQQLDQEAKEKEVGSSRPLQIKVANQEAAAKAEKKADNPAADQAVITARRDSSASQLGRRDSIGSATTAFDSPTKENFPSDVQREGSGPARPKGPRGTARALVAPPSDVLEVQEPEEDSHVADSDTEDGTEIHEPSGAQRVPFIVDTGTNDGSFRNDEKSEFRFIPISSVKAGKARRPRTRETRVSFRSNPSHIDRQHGTAPACKQCFRAGFDCAMNLQLGEGTAARKAFQNFVNAGGLNALSIRDSPRAIEDRGSVTVEEALGRNYVDKLGEVAFGESALSRPVTRGMINELLEEKQEREKRRVVYADHKPWSDLEDPDEARVKRSFSSKTRRASQITLQDGVDPDQIQALDSGDDAREVLLNNMKRSLSQQRGMLEEGEVVDIDPADYYDDNDEYGVAETSSSASSGTDIVVWADLWTAWTKLRQLLAYWILVFALQALASGYSNTVPRIITASGATDSTTPLLFGLGSLAYNGCQCSGLLLANSLVGFGRQRILLVTLVLTGGAAVIAGFVPHVAAILPIQTLLGILSGISAFLSLATIMDLFATSKGRLFGICSLALVVIGGQLAGPWISKLVLFLLNWSWTYWIVTIVAGLLIVYTGIATRESAAFVLFRRGAMRLKRTGERWTPEPQLETTLRQVVVDDLVRPFRLLRHNPMLILLCVGLSALGGVYAFLFSGLQAVFTGVHGLTPTNAALASTLSAAIGLLVGVLAIYLINSRRENDSGFATKARPLYLDEKGHIDTRRPLRTKTESLLPPALFATATFSFALYTLALTASYATTWFLTAFSVVLATASPVVVGIALVQYVLDGYSPPRKVMLRDVVAREDPSTPTLLQDGEEDRFTSYSRRTAARFQGGHNGRHHKPDHSTGGGEGWLDAGESVISTRDKRWLDETALAAVTVVVALLFPICSVLAFVSSEALPKLSFGAFSVIFASASLVVLLALLCVYLYGAKTRAQSLIRLNEADADRAHGRRAKSREQRAMQRSRSNSRSYAASQQQKSGPLRLVKRFADALGYKPLSDDGLEVYRRSDPQQQQQQGQAGRVFVRPRTPAPLPLMQESTATAAAEGRRELWLSKLVDHRNKMQEQDSAGQAIKLNEATEAQPSTSGIKASMPAWTATLFGQPQDPLGRTLNASTSLPTHLHHPTLTSAPSPKTQLGLSPPPRAQPRASISHQSPHTRQSSAQKGFEIVRLQSVSQDQIGEADRPITPVMTRRSVDMSRTNIMARSQSQPLISAYDGRQKVGLGLRG